MSIFVSSTKQTDSGRTSFAAAASFCALLFAASPTISIRSGISRATFNALSPMDPVAPRTTTRLRFIWTKHHTTITTAHGGKEVLLDLCESYCPYWSACEKQTL